MRKIYQVKEYTSESRLKKECWYFSQRDTADYWVAAKPYHRDLEEICVYDDLSDMESVERQDILNRLTTKERKILGL